MFNQGTLFGSKYKPAQIICRNSIKCSAQTQAYVSHFYCPNLAFVSLDTVWLNLSTPLISSSSDCCWKPSTPDATLAADSWHSPQGHAHSTLLCSSAAIQLTSAALEIQHYHIIYEGWPSGMHLKPEYQLSSCHLALRPASWVGRLHFSSLCSVILEPRFSRCYLFTI